MSALFLLGKSKPKTNEVNEAVEDVTIERGKKDD